MRSDVDAGNDAATLATNPWQSPAKTPGGLSAARRRSKCNTVHVIDPDEGTRCQLATLLSSVKFDVETFLSARTFLDSRTSPASSDPFCVISEIRTPEMSGLEMQQELLRRSPNARVIFLSEHVDITTAVRAMRAGALSVLRKPIHEQELIDLLNWHFNECTSHRTVQPSHFFSEKRALLTPRQRDVFDRLILGLRSKEVAAQLELSHRTVEVHRAQILNRLHEGSINHLIQKLLETSMPAR